MFAQRPEEKSAWAALPGEPLERDDAADILPASDVDPLTLGLGASVTSIVFPVAPVLEEGAGQADAEPGDPEQD